LVTQSAANALEAHNAHAIIKTDFISAPQIVVRPSLTSRLHLNSSL